MKKRFLAVLALLVLVPTIIFATGVAITWEWMIDDPQVTGFRYQLDDENVDNWIVVDGETTSAVFQNLEGSAEYSLYLQQTFDGVNWSDSAVSVAYPLFEAEPVVAEVVEEIEPVEVPIIEAVIEAPVEEVVVEAPMVEAVVETPMVEAVVETPMVEAVVETPVESPIKDVVFEAPKKEVAIETPMKESVIEAPMKEATSTGNGYYTSIGFNLGASYDLAEIEANESYTNLQPVIGLSFGFNNIKAINENIGFGVDLDANLVGYIGNGADFFEETLVLYQDNTDFSLQIALVPEIEFIFGDLGIDLGLVGGMTLVNVNYVGTANINPSDLFEYGIFTYGLKAGFDYRLTDLIRFGFDATATKINDLSITDFDYSIDGTMSMKLTF